MYAAYAAPTVADHVHDVQCLSVVQLAVRDCLAEQVNGVVHPARAQAMQGEVVCSVVVGHEAAFEFRREVDSFCFPDVFRRRTTAFVKADLEADDSLEISRSQVQ